MTPITTKESNGEEAGIFPKLLRGLLRYLGLNEWPLYQGFKEEVNDREEWRVEVHIDTQRHNNKPLIFEAYGRRSTFEAGVCDAARQAIFRVRDMYAVELSNSPYRYFPRRRICNTRKRICRYNKRRRQHGPNLLIQQIRLTKALDAACDVALDEVREVRFTLREREEELEALRGHTAMNGNEGVSISIGGSSAISDALAQAQARGDHRRPPSTAITAVPAPPMLPRTRSSVGGGGGGDRRAACSRSLQSKPAPARRAPAPCGRRRAGGGMVNENSVSSFGAGASSCIIGGAGDALPEGHRDRPRPPRTQNSCAMHQVAVEPPRRDRAPTSSLLEGRVRGKDLVSFISDAGVALGKQPVISATTTNNNNPGDATTSTSSSAPRSSARQRS